MIKKALFWDFDGTIILPNESFLCALESALKGLNYKIDTNHIRNFLHSTCSWYMPQLSYEETTGNRWWESLFAKFEVFYDSNRILKEDRDVINGQFKQYILNYKNYTVYDDAKEVLSQCKVLGYSNYILSNNFPELPMVIQKLGLAEYFTDFIVSSNVGFEKPRIEIFDYALHIAGNPEVCYMIGDNPVADIQGGKEAGMKTILVHNKVSAEFCENNMICESLIDIIKIID